MDQWNGNSTAKGKESDNAFFLERLEAFLEKNLMDIGAFAEREGRSSEEIRRRVAEWHFKFLFKPGRTRDGETADKIRDILISTSQNLETLHTISGRQSLLLVVDPSDDSDESFLGGTVNGREFWRGMRGGGSAGARAFKEKCKGGLPTPSPSTTNIQRTARPGTPPTPAAKNSKGITAIETKNELYMSMRTALRNACGIRNAEMKWTKPEKLSVYGVRLVGWPSDIENKNPSQMSMREMTSLSFMLKTGQLRFDAIEGSHIPTLLQSIDDTPEVDADMAWACNEDVLSSDQPSSMDTPNTRVMTTHSSSSTQSFALYDFSTSNGSIGQHASSSGHQGTQQALEQISLEPGPTLLPAAPSTLTSSPASAQFSSHIPLSAVSSAELKQQRQKRPRLEKATPDEPVRLTRPHS